MKKNVINETEQEWLQLQDPDLTNPPVQVNLLVESETIPEQVIKNVEVINYHKDQHRQSTKTHQRVLNKIGAIFGSPQFLYGQIVFFTAWIISSNLAAQKIIPKNFPLFDLHLHGLEIAALLISTEVLVYQTREEKIRAEQSHLMLQLNLVTEQKIAKLISLVEELRVDLPDVIDRDDLEAEIMKQATSPQAILEAIQQNNLAEHLPSSQPESQPRQIS
jgi:uncharacterized membrane protein